MAHASEIYLSIWTITTNLIVFMVCVCSLIFYLRSQAASQDTKHTCPQQLLLTHSHTSLSLSTSCLLAHCLLTAQLFPIIFTREVLTTDTFCRCHHQSKDGFPAVRAPKNASFLGAIGGILVGQLCQHCARSDWVARGVLTVRGRV